MVSSTDESYDPHARMHESFPRVDSGSKGTQMAGSVISIPDLQGSGQDSRAADYATGKNQSPDVSSIGRDTLRGWVSRTQNRLGKSGGTSLPTRNNEE